MSIVEQLVEEIKDLKVVSNKIKWTYSGEARPGPEDIYIIVLRSYGQNQNGHIDFYRQTKYSKTQYMNVTDNWRDFSSSLGDYYWMSFEIPVDSCITYIGY